MTTPLDGLPPWLGATVALLLIAGSTLTLLGAFGLVQLKSFYDRIHAPTLGTSWGTATILLASILAYSWIEGRLVVHELIIGIFVTVTTPVTLMVLARAALQRDREEGRKDVPPPRQMNVTPEGPGRAGEG